MQLHDTRTRSTSTFVPAATVRLYVCGITPYDSAHLGHAFTYTVFDVLIRHLEAKGHRVRYVRNVTDLDDDILRTAAARDVNFEVLARTEAAAFDTNLRRLGLRDADVIPYATETVPAMIPMVQGLLDRELAYQLPDGRVYADTGQMEGFLSFSRLDRETALEQFAEKGGDPDAAGKNDPLDFLLWQPSAPGEPGWVTPWGDPSITGRPGWHLECSVMAMEHLGNVIDIHGGGNDLIFPHHEAEILQSEGLTGQGPFAGVWMHVGMVALEDVKMSKSLGNLVFLGDLLDRYSPWAVRHLLLRNHYRSGWTYTEESMMASAEAAAALESAPAGDAGRADALRDAVAKRLDDDLDTPAALALIDDAVADGDGDAARRAAELLGYAA
ncbi:class I tRNA ligase family protein [Euzebya tangerina]|uniref:class I tRNA ligase family protein n=1 Tax=Euzebya tangerina TaxID=591198 RepID=UPI000E30F913|nr:class I tRNA ligase family protein [Euzebya tangerina]